MNKNIKILATLTILLLALHKTAFSQLSDAKAGGYGAPSEASWIKPESKDSNTLFQKNTNNNLHKSILRRIGIDPLNHTVDKESYDSKMQDIARYDTEELWPITQPYPLKNAILPFKRIIAFYGNLYTPRMGILGSKPASSMLEKLKKVAKEWEEADPTTPVVPALHYIAVVASSTPADEGLYIKRMPKTQIEKILKIAEQVNALVFLDIQPGFSNLETEIPRLSKYLSMPHVHLGIDPEFFMKGTSPPGRVLGNITAKEINYAISYLSKLVDELNLPPKVLVIHRFKLAMVKHYYSIKPTKQVQVVIHMDGWGTPQQKKNTYEYVAYNEPVQFTGFKVFYGNDLKYSPYRLVTIKEMLELSPIPLYIQYQ